MRVCWPLHTDLPDFDLPPVPQFASSMMQKLTSRPTPPPTYLYNCDCDCDLPLPLLALIPLTALTTCSVLTFHWGWERREREDRGRGESHPSVRKAGADYNFTLRIVGCGINIVAVEGGENIVDPSHTLITKRWIGREAPVNTFFYAPNRGGGGIP